MRGLGRAVFVAILLLIAGTLNVIYGIAGFSLMAGEAFGRMVGIVAASLGAIGALLAVGGANPFWALGVFAICVICIHGLVVYGEPEQV